MKTTESVRVDVNDAIIASVYARPEMWIQAFWKDAKIRLIEADIFVSYLTFETIRGANPVAYTMISQLAEKFCNWEVISRKEARAFLSREWTNMELVKERSRKAATPELLGTPTRALTPGQDLFRSKLSWVLHVRCP